MQALQYGFLDFSNFSVEEYEHFEVCGWTLEIKREGVGMSGWVGGWVMGREGGGRYGICMYMLVVGVKFMQRNLCQPADGLQCISV